MSNINSGNNGKMGPPGGMRIRPKKQMEPDAELTESSGITEEMIKAGDSVMIDISAAKPAEVDISAAKLVEINIASSMPEQIEASESDLPENDIADPAFEDAYQEFEGTQQQFQQAMNTGEQENEPGKSQALGSAALGVVSIVCWFFGWFSVASVILGIIGLRLASHSKKMGYTGSMRRTGFLLSLIGAIGGILFLIAIIAFGAIIGIGGGLDELSGI